MEKMVLKGFSKFYLRKTDYMDREIVLVTRDNYFIIHTFENELKITLLPLKTITFILKYSLDKLSLTCKND